MKRDIVSIHSSIRDEVFNNPRMRRWIENYTNRATGEGKGAWISETGEVQDRSRNTIVYATMLRNGIALYESIGRT